MTLNAQTTLSKDLAAGVDAAREDWQRNDKVARLWAADPSVWTNQDEHRWLGWLTIVDSQRAHAGRFQSIGEDVKRAGFTHALLLGMGGSSLGPEVMAMTFGQQPGFPTLLVLDSTDPAQIKTFEEKIDLRKTIFIVSSKSGSTLEPNIFMQYFFDLVSRELGEQEAGNRFMAITDPGSKMQQEAERRRFRHTFFGLPTIGGRYSVLSDFGLVPSAIMGVDVGRLLDSADEMVRACRHTTVRENPGVSLGLAMGTAANAGIDKLTIVPSPAIYDFGAWLEQLVAESTGKNGKAVIPVDRETLAAPDVYGKDRLFAYIRLESAPDTLQDAGVDALEQAGHAVVRIRMKDIDAIGQEFFRWEIATAVAGSVMGINPFDQPDVEASKIVTRSLATAYEETGALPPESPLLDEGGIKLYTDERNSAALTRATGDDRTLAGFLRAHLNRLHDDDYFALLAYVEMNDAHERLVQSIRHTIRDRRRVATCLGFGPRFLHSTGQAYKGGSNSGVFLQVTCDPAQDLPVPGQKYSFGIVEQAQARGDFQVLVERERRALRVHLGADVRQGLTTLLAIVEQVT